MKNLVGRPIKENSLRKTGKRYDFLLSKEDDNRLAVLANFFELDKSNVLRMLIRNTYKQLGVNENE